MLGAFALTSPSVDTRPSLPGLLPRSQLIASLAALSVPLSHAAASSLTTTCLSGWEDTVQRYAIHERPDDGDANGGTGCPPPRVSALVAQLARYGIARPLRGAPATLYELRPALEAPPLRRLFYPNEFHLPPSAAPPTPTLAQSSFARFALSAEDHQALAHLFPAHHGDRLYRTVDEYVTHCRSDTHTFFCEGMPLTPLAAVPRVRHGATAARAKLVPPITYRTCARPAASALTDSPPLVDVATFHALYGELHRLVYRHSCTLLTQARRRGDRCRGEEVARRDEALAICLADALGVVLATAVLSVRGPPNAPAPRGTARSLCVLVARHVRRWWRAEQQKVSSALCRALTSAFGTAVGQREREETTLEMRFFAPLCSGVAQHLLSVERRGDVARLYKDDATEPVTSQPDPPCDPRCRRESLTLPLKRPRTPPNGFVDLFDLLLSLLLCDPANQIPLTSAS